MKITIQPITNPGDGQILLPLLFSGVTTSTASKITSLANTIQAAAADGSFSLTEDFMIGLAFGALFTK
jgi:hypothetical protein